MYREFPDMIELRARERDLGARPPLNGPRELKGETSTIPAGRNDSSRLLLARGRCLIDFC